MKNLILVIAIALTPIVSNAQIKVSTTKTVDIYKTPLGQHTLTKTVIDSSDHYTFFFRDMKYTTITEIKYLSFKDKEEVSQFFTIVGTVITSAEDVILNMNDELVSVKNYNKGAAMIFYKSGWFFFSTKQTDELLEAVKNLQ